MAENKTENFGLNQWEKTDPIRVEDFNKDNRKIEAALTAAMRSSGCVTGTYVGSDGTYEVNLGFRPSFLVLIPVRTTNYSSDIMGAFGVDGYMVACMRSNGNTTYKYCFFTDTGFRFESSNFYSPDLTCHYVAFY